MAGGAFLLFGSSATRVNDPVAQAATISSSAAGYRIHMLVSFPSPSGGTPITGVGNGTIDARDHAASVALAMNFGSSPQVIRALGGSTLRMTELLDGTTVYMKPPPALSGMLGASGKPWLKLDAAKALRVPALASMSAGPGMSDPGQLLQYLRAVSGNVVSEGQQWVDGFDTTHYHAELSLDHVVSALPPADQGGAQQAISALEQSVQVHKIPVDVWVDAAHLIRHMQMTISATPASGQPMTIGLAMDFSDYGPQPRPAVPPADQVQDLSALAGA